MSEDSKFSRKNKPMLKDKMVGVMLDQDEMERLEEITYNKSGWCRDVVLAAMDKHDYDSKG